MSCIEMFRTQIIALSNNGMSQHKIVGKVSQKVLCSEPYRGLEKEDPFPQDQDMADQELPLSERINTSRQPLCTTGWQLLVRSKHFSITLKRSQSVKKKNSKETFGFKRA